MVPDSLIQQYVGGNVIPVIGCGMMFIKEGYIEVNKENNGKVDMENDINIHDYLIHKQFKKTEKYPNPPDSFYDLQLIDPQFNQNYIAGFFRNIGDEKDNSLLDKLSRLGKFRLFIMASMFKDFEDLLQANNKNEDFDIRKNDSTNSSELTSINPDEQKRRLVYLFGREDSPLFAINEADRLEYLFSLAKTSSLPGSLLNLLSGKTLLFLGCDFSDWFMRYCIRVLYNLPYKDDPRVYIINDKSAPLNYQKPFFEKYGIELIHQYPVKKFMNEFFAKAVAAQPFVDKFNGKHVFLSYSRYDKEIAKKVYICLRSMGIKAWYDEKDREIGEHVQIIQQQIMNAAVTKVMICVISADLVAETKQADNRSYVRDVEWDAAEIRIKAARMRNEADKFGIVPYFVDDPRPYLADLPPFIDGSFRYGELKGGCEVLAEAIKDFLK